ncbi:hypothetical protein [Kitasatospora purpeofusca]|uniref:hypothetical protein n=1 Tax=Kitasatospora purpeofusca TaxID=67352 RepID=UPI0012FE80F2|nr:hypothetical protein [Kitasatospora purpeofusca]
MIRRAIIAIAATALTAAVTTGISPATEPDLTDQQFAHLDPARQTKILEPLRAVANALGDQGRSTHSGIYGSLTIDAPKGHVVLYVTDISKANRLIADAKKSSPSIDTSVIRLAKANYSRKDLAEARDQVMADSESQKLLYSVRSVSLNPDSSGLKVVTDKVNAATAVAKSEAMQYRTATGARIPISFEAGEALESLEWRWNDEQPFIAGDYVGVNGHQCTTGAVAGIGTGDFILTAAHCFPDGWEVYGNAYPYHDLAHQWTGNRIGTVTNVSPQWDMEAIYTGTRGGIGATSDEADNVPGQWYRVEGVAYSYNGDWVCQNGITSYYSGHGVPCGIKVTNDDTSWRTSNPYWWDGLQHTSRGVCGHADNWAADHGDSGALVFAFSGGTRQARGSVSAGSDTKNVCWTEIKDYFREVGLSLSPYHA